jgi:predicted anti-sigma-YlaC factor YlaD
MSSIRPRICDDARQWASLRLDAELTEFEEFLLQEHLRRCFECAAYADAIATTTSALRATPPLSLDVPLSAPARRRMLPLRAVSFAAAAAAVVAAVGIGSLVGSVGRPGPAVGARIPRAAVSSQPGGMQGLIEQPKLAMLRAKAGIGKQRGLYVLDV